MESWLLAGRVVLAGLLYAFLAAVFIVLWRDMRAAEATLAQPPHEAGGHLVVLTGNKDILPGSILPLRPFTTLGRGSANTIVLPDTFVSTEHAIIALRNGQWWLEDRDSRNGTRLNDVPVETPMVLNNGDIISIGQLRLRMEIETREYAIRKM